MDADAASFLSVLVEVLQGLFPSVDGALQALARSSPRRFPEELFGGRFLKNAAALNFSGAVGSQGGVGVAQLSSSKYQGLVQSVGRILEEPSFLSALQNTLTGLSGSASLEQVRDGERFHERHVLDGAASSCRVSVLQVLAPLLRSCFAEEDEDAASLYVPSCTASGAFQEVQCRGGQCWCVDPQGREVAGSRSAGRPTRCPTRCETDRSLALRTKSGLAASAEVHVPACSADGAFLPLQCVGSRCFCVDADGRTVTAAGGAVSCRWPEQRRKLPLNMRGFGAHI